MMNTIGMLLSSALLFVCVGHRGRDTCRTLGFPWSLMTKTASKFALNAMRRVAGPQMLNWNQSHLASVQTWPRDVKLS